MELPLTAAGNRYVLVFQDHLTMVFPMPDQKSERIATLLVNEVVPFFGVPEALLSDRGINLLSHLMMDLCDLLGVKKLNTTTYHPQCNGMIERFNRTLKSYMQVSTGTSTYLEYCGLTGTPLMKAQERSRHSCCSGLIAEGLQKLLFSRLTRWNQVISTTTARR